MGEKQNQPFQLSFNPSLRVDFQGSRVTSDSDLLLVRELDERLGLSLLMAEHITDDRRGKNTQLPLPDPVATVHLWSAGGIRVVLDLDSTEIPVYGQQEQSAYNGTSSQPVITRCYCSTGRETASGLSCG
jgi:hypothetical protein